MMENNKILVIFLCWYNLINGGCMCASKTLIESVKHICRDSQGRVGRCTTPAMCHSSIEPSSSTSCAIRRVCCTLERKLAYEDDDDEIQRIPSKLKAVHEIPHNLALEIGTSSHHPAVAQMQTTAGPNAPESGVSSTSAPRATSSAEEKQLFSSPPVCGPVIVGHKIHGGAEAALGEFPWLANLEYRTTDGGLEIACAGNIINHRYILTAGHCVKGLIEEKIGKLESVRVGDHNTETPKDCDDEICIDAFQRFKIVKKIIHEKFNMTANRRLYSDIALLKTDGDIKYSMSVAPICMPAVVEIMPRLQTKVRLTVAGWGANEEAAFTDEKRIVDVPYIENDACSIAVQDDQICAGGETGKDSCTGDSGGSLAKLTQSGWVIVGIVSFGRKCGKETPAIYTRVSSYLPWIEKHIDST